MGHEIQFIDIILLAVVAGFLVFRLRSVLGRRTGNEPRHDASAPNSEAERDNVVDLSDRYKPSDEPVIDENQPHAAGLAQIARVDSTFTPETFLAGARRAFEMIVEGFAKGKPETLRPLVADDVFARFDAAIKDRESRGEVMETEVVSFKSMDISNAVLNGRMAEVTITFVTEQMIVVRDKNGRVIEGDPTRYDIATDIWTFQRDTGSRDPNWRLIATETPA